MLRAVHGTRRKSEVQLAAVVSFEDHGSIRVGLSLLE
jgi:hypothetical protein